MKGQPMLFPELERARAKPRVMMRILDAGDEVASFECSRCGHRTGWVGATVTEQRRGKPCPQCNGTEARQ